MATPEAELGDAEGCADADAGLLLGPLLDGATAHPVISSTRETDTNMTGDAALRARETEVVTGQCRALCWEVAENGSSARSATTAP